MTLGLHYTGEQNTLLIGKSVCLTDDRDFALSTESAFFNVHKRWANEGFACVCEEKVIY